MNISDLQLELSRLDEVPSLEGNRYAECAETYEAASNQRMSMLAWLRENLVSSLPMDCAAVLSVGSGSGVFDNQFLGSISSTVREVSYVGIDPNPHQCERFTQLLETRVNGRVRVGVHAADFENHPFRERFDLVHMTHSLYYMDEPAQTIDTALNLLKDGGRLVIFLAPNGILNQLADKFWNLERGRRSWFSEDLEGHIEEQKIPFEKDRIDAKLDVTSCFVDGSEEGARIIDFIVQAETDQLPDNLRAMIFEYLQRVSTYDGARYWLPHPVDVFSIEADVVD